MSLELQRLEHSEKLADATVLTDASHCVGFENFLITIVPARGELCPVKMSKFMPEKSSEPAHKLFYSHILGFRRLRRCSASFLPDFATLNWLQFGRLSWPHLIYSD